MNAVAQEAKDAKHHPEWSNVSPPSLGLTPTSQICSRGTLRSLLPDIQPRHRPMDYSPRPRDQAERVDATGCAIGSANAGTRSRTRSEESAGGQFG